MEMRSIKTKLSENPS